MEETDVLKINGDDDDDDVQCIEIWTCQHIRITDMLILYDQLQVTLDDVASCTGKCVSLYWNNTGISHSRSGSFEDLVWAPGIAIKLDINIYIFLFRTAYIHLSIKRIYYLLFLVCIEITYPLLV